MMNSAVFGGAAARAALESSLFDPELDYIGTDWCAGGCSLWKDSEAGRLLRANLLERTEVFLSKARELGMIQTDSTADEESVSKCEAG